MPNNDWNTILLSVIMFVSSYGFLLTKRSTRQVIQHFSIKKSAIDISVPIKYALVDLVCPAGSNKMEQHIKNDQIINYLLKGKHNTNLCLMHCCKETGFYDF